MADLAGIWGFSDAEGLDVSLSVSALAPFLAVEADVPERSSPNAVTLFHGHPARIGFTPADKGERPRFAFRDRHLATHRAPRIQ
ncbi:glycoside hydrolase family 2 protein [Ostreiculturibacter nitratireducens]|uniref:glycoside hydrolase family 2 protein n=1 Tax=Ostreiculturibacter nitratireducens TaxID=3075226 RepID=UPI0031B5F30A